MAYAALVFLARELEQLLPQHDVYIHIYDKEQMESLHSNINFLLELLQDFPGNYGFIKRLESQITGYAYAVSDIFAWGFYDGRLQVRLESHVKKFDSFVEEAKEIRKALEMKNEMSVQDPRITSSSTIVALSGKDTMVGLDADFIQIKERIDGHNSSLQIIPICGMGGIGKTTLAKKVYEDLSVTQFDVRIWVTVSQIYDTQKILKEIIGDAETKEGDTLSLITSVHKKLTSKRFLIVMDDIWNVEAWDSVRNAFPDGNNSSRIIVTTRLLGVAAEVGSKSLIHQMELMNEGLSWELFQKETFGNKYFPPQLVNVGEIISKNCKGLPLAIVVIARLLKLNSTQDYWKKFATNMKEAMADATPDNQLTEILSLSYDSLPPHLKACFLYTSLFPEDAEITSKKLISLWVAEGFLKPTPGMSMEEVAEKCLVGLVHRNLIFVTKMRSNGRIKTCIVHDVLRDLSLRKAEEDKFSQQIITQNTGTETDSNFEQTVYLRRRVGVSSRFLEDYRTQYGYVYSLILHDDKHYFRLISRTTSYLLRVLEAPKISLSGSLAFGINLRYLNFTFEGYNDDNLKATLANLLNLKNLETLIIRQEYSFFEIMFFPILEMPKLKHFVLDDQNTNTNYCLIVIDNHHLATSNSGSNNSLLQTLSGVKDLEFTTDAVGIFANLVKLKIKYLNVMPVCLSNLVFLHQLEELSFSFLLQTGWLGDLSLPTNITFPHKLTKITFFRCMIAWETMSAIGSLPKLEVLKLVSCWFESGEWEPVDGEFEQLKYLKLDVQNLEKWNVDSTHFPSLEQLILCECERLKEFPDEIGEINSLWKLVIYKCPNHIVQSAWTLLEKQQSFDNYEFQLFVNGSRY